MKRDYRDEKGRLLHVVKVIPDNTMRWRAYRRIRYGISIWDEIINGLDERGTEMEAQADLDRYAMEHGLEEAI